MLLKLAEVHRGILPPLHHPEEVSQRISSMTCERYHHTSACLPKHPSDSCNWADCPLYILCHLRVNRHAWWTKTIGCIIALCQSDSRGRGPTSAFQCLEWIANCQHVPGWPGRMNKWSCSQGTRGSNLVLWKMIMQRGAPYKSARDIGF